MSSLSTDILFGSGVPTIRATQGVIYFDIANAYAVYVRTGSYSTGTWQPVTSPAVVHGIPAGGTTGQALEKASNADYDVGWFTPAGPLVVVPVASGAAPVNVDALAPRVTAFAITTGGTGGTETVNLNNLPDAFGPLGARNIGARAIVYLATQTDPGDSVQVTIAGATTAHVWDGAHVEIQTLDPVVLDYEGACLSLVWNSGRWIADNTADNSSSVVASRRPPPPTGGASNRFLAKATAADGDFDWHAGVIIDSPQNIYSDTSNTLTSQIEITGALALGAGAMRDAIAGGQNVALGISALRGSITVSGTITALAFSAFGVSTASIVGPDPTNGQEIFIFCPALAIEGLFTVSNVVPGVSFDFNHGFTGNVPGVYTDGGTGSNNIGLGTGAGLNIAGGSNNIAIGSGNGAGVNLPDGDADNQLNIANFIFGTAMDGAGAGISSGGVGFGVKAPTVPVHSIGAVRTEPTTVAALPPAATAGAGARHFVTDASTTLILGLGLAVVGLGANKVPVYSDGAAWRIG